jgi:hypothetical protein
MKQRSHASIGLAVGAALALTLMSGSASAVNEVTVYGVANFGGAGECGGPFSSHARHTTSAANFRAPFDALIAAGDWDEADTNNNLSARGSYFTDPAEGSSTSNTCCQSYQPSTCSCVGQDNQSNVGVDQGDIFFIHTHGGSTHPAGVPFMGLQMGNESYDCRPRSHEDWEFGNGSGDLEIAVVEACQSMDYEVWQGGGHWQFSTTSSTFTMFNAYHGNVSCSDARTAEIGTYADSAENDGVGDNWLDLMHSSSASAGGDNCPVSVVFGDTAALRDSMYNFGGWRDRKSTSDKTHSTIYYIGGCAPSGGSVLPNG